MICISPMGESAQSYVESTTVLSDPSKNELARSCKILACKTCMARARDMSLFLHDSCTILQDLAHILQEMVQDFARDAARIITRKFRVSCTISCKICARSCKNCARIVQEKGHIACTCHASLACKILAQSCMILQVRFCWDYRSIINQVRPKTTGHCTFTCTHHHHL